MNTHMMGPYELAAYRAGAPIRDIVRRGQETLVRLYLAGKHQERLRYAENALKQVSHTVDMCPPRTLGELCLKEAHDRFDYEASFEYPFIDLFAYAGRMADFRRALYHRNTGYLIFGPKQLSDRVGYIAWKLRQHGLIAG